MDNLGISENMVGTGIIRLDSIYNKRKYMIARNYPAYLKLAEDCVSQNYTIAEGIDLALIERAKQSGKKIDGPVALPPILFRKSMNYSYSALCLLREGHIDATYSCIRSCVEHIWKAYYLLLAEEDAKNLLFKDEIRKGVQPSELPADKKLTPDEEEKIKKDFHYFQPRYFRGYLYDGDKRKSMDTIYHHLSNSTHPSITGSMAEIDFRSESVEDLLKMIIAISLSISVVGIEVYPESISTREHERLNRAINRVADALGSLPDFIPNKPKNIGTLRMPKWKEAEVKSG